MSKFIWQLDWGKDGEITSKSGAHNVGRVRLRLPNKQPLRCFDAETTASLNNVLRNAPQGGDAVNRLFWKKGIMA